MDNTIIMISHFYDEFLIEYLKYHPHIIKFDTEISLVKSSIYLILQMFVDQINTFKPYLVQYRYDEGILMFLSSVANLIYTLNNIWSTLELKHISQISQILKFSELKGQSILHEAFGNCYTNHKNRVYFLKLLLMSNADTNTLNEIFGDRPLHSLVQLVNYGGLNEYDLLLDLFIKHGAHLDVRNQMNETPYDILNKKIDKLKPKIKLICLAARVICVHKIPYENKVPKSLYEFIHYHC